MDTISFSNDGFYGRPRKVKFRNDVLNVQMASTVVWAYGCPVVLATISNALIYRSLSMEIRNENEIIY